MGTGTPPDGTEERLKATPGDEESHPQTPSTRARARRRAGTTTTPTDTPTVMAGTVTQSACPARSSSVTGRGTTPVGNAGRGGNQTSDRLGAKMRG